MARTAQVVLLAILAGASLGSALGSEPKEDVKARPTMEEYKAGKAEEAKNKTAKADDNKKGAAVDKVVEMLENLQQQVISEGEKEAATYDKFACFCRDMTHEKTEAIKKGRDQREELSANIERLTKERADLDKKIGEINGDIEKTNKHMAEVQEESDKALVVYERNEADLTGAIFGVTEAIKALKASKSPSLLQVQSASKTIETALMLADALGLKSAKAAGQIFLQEPAPEVEMENYKFHSGGIVETCEGLLGDFNAEKNRVDAEEVDRVQQFNMEKQRHTDRLKALTLELDESKAAKEQRSEDIATNSEELTTVSATLLDDQQYLSELSSGCSDKAKTWDQRSKMRVAELTAITEAMDIVKETVKEMTQSSTIRFVQVPSADNRLQTADAVANDDSSMMAIEAEAEDSESAPIGFLQKRMLSVIKKHQSSAGDDGIAKQMVVSLLKNKGMQLKSTLLLSLASQVGGQLSGDPLAKVKTLIQDLIERLLTEAANEANQKGWCDKAMGDAKQKRDISAGKVDELNAEMAKLEATRDKLAEEITELTDAIAELTKAQGTAEKMRTDEKAENKETVYDARQGLEATGMAIKILSRFYATAAKAKVDLDLAQGPFDDAPDAGFKDGEAYTAQVSDSGGIVGMLEVIASDFTRTIKETEKAETEAEHEFQQFMTESSMSLAEKKMALEQNTKYADENSERLENAKDNLMTQTDILVTSIKELMELKPACIDTGMSYADRVAMREQEIEALKKAGCILAAYAKSGPDGLSDAC